MRRTATDLQLGHAGAPRPWIQGNGNHVIHFSAVVLAAALLLALAFTSSASAATTYQSAGQISSGLSGFNSAQGMAVDDASDQLLVANEDQINVYAGSGAEIPSLITSFGAGTLSNPAAIAINQASGAIYIGDAGHNRIVKYTSDHAPTPTFTLDASYVSPPAGAGPGEIGDFSSPMAVDPRNGDLLVADAGNHRVSRFSAAGAFLDSFDGSDSAAGTFHTPVSIAVDATGEIYIVDGIRLPVPNFGEAAFERFTAGGVADGSLTPPDRRPTAVAFDANSGNILLASRAGEGEGEPQAPSLLYVFHGGSIVTSVEFQQASVGGLVGALATNGHTGRLYGRLRPYFGGEHVIQVFDSVVVPDVTVDDPTGVTDSQATFHGEVDPVGLATTYHFEYSEDGGRTFKSAPELEAPSTAGPVEQTVTDLEPNQSYVVRLRGTNSMGSLTSFETRTFSTAAASPSVVTGAASEVELDSAYLNGTVAPHGLPTTYQFEWGLTTAYGQTAPVDHAAPAGKGHEVRSVVESTSGLAAGATYHYRIVATNSIGTAYGEDREFTTSGGDGRVYELVSPTEKGGSNVGTREGGQATANGERIAYEWKTAPSGAVNSESAPYFPKTVSIRGSGGWTTKSTDPPELSSSAVERQVMQVTTIAVSPDGTHALVASKKALAPGASEGDSNIYVRDVDTGAYKLVVTVPGTEANAYATGVGQTPFIDGNSDFSRILLGGALPYHFLPNAPDYAMYEWSDSEGMKLVSIDQEGNPLGSINAGGSSQQSRRDTRFMSDDGNVIVIPQNAGTVYVRVGIASYAAGTSRASADAGTIHEATYDSMTADGRYVFISAQGLTDDSEPGVTNIYRFDTQTQELKLLIKGAGWFQMGGEGSSIFFATGLDLAPGSTEGGLNIDVWDEGVIDHVATLEPGRDFINEFMASPNGRYFAFTSYSSLTGYDNSSTTACLQLNLGDPGTACQEVYRYDVGTKALTCASCRDDGGRVTGNAYMGPYTVDHGGHHFPRTVLNNGLVLFDTPDPLSPRDVNSARDVYSFDGQKRILISAGTGNGDSKFADASADGRDVFFTTQDQLVPVDNDNLMDMYDARVGGGLSSQHPPATAMPCKGEACQGQATSAPASPSLGSGALRTSKKNGIGGSSRIRRIRRPTSSMAAKLAAGGTAYLEVMVTGAGKVSVVGSARLDGRKHQVVSASVKAKGDEAVRVPISLSKGALAELRMRGALSISLTVRHGAAPPKSVSLQLRATATKKGGRS